jgi:serine/threonine protein kinase
MELCDLTLHEYVLKQWPKFSSDIRRYFPASRKYDISIVCEIMADIARGLGHIHSLEEVHRDLKPRNSIS